MPGFIRFANLPKIVFAGDVRFRHRPLLDLQHLADLVPAGDVQRQAVSQHAAMHVQGQFGRVVFGGQVCQAGPAKSPAGGTA